MSIKMRLKKSNEKLTTTKYGVILHSIDASLLPSSLNDLEIIISNIIIIVHFFPS